MKGNKILLTGPDPRGRQIEGIISGTPKPGTCMEIKAATAPVGGRHTWEVYAPGTDGQQRIVAVLLEDWPQGKLPTDAYVSGSQGMIYIPQAGDELNMLVEDVAGTAETYAIGDLLIIDTGTGKLAKDTGSPQMESFIVMEAVGPGIAADTLIHCMYTGH